MMRVRALGQGQFAVMPELRPGWALVDRVATEGWGGSGLTPDDVDWDRLRRADQADIRRAAAVFQLQDAVLDGIGSRAAASARCASMQLR